MPQQKLKEREQVHFNYYTVQFFLGDGSAVIPTGSLSNGTPYVGIPADSMIESWAVVADATGSVTVDILRSTYAAFPPASPVPGLGQIILSNQRKNNGSATGTSVLTQGDQLLASVSSSATVKNASVQLTLRTILS